jgi:hypothetical protein
MRFFCRAAFLIAAFTVLALPSFAQDDLEKLLKESAEDGRKLIGAYVLGRMLIR